MAHQHDESLGLTKAEVAAAFAHDVWADKFPPILTLEQAAELVQVPRGTVYSWRSQGLLKGCCRRVGKHLRFFRDRLILKLMNEGLYSDEQK